MNICLAKKRKNKVYLLVTLLIWQDLVYRSDVEYLKTNYYITKMKKKRKENIQTSHIKLVLKKTFNLRDNSPGSLNAVQYCTL